MKKLFLLSFFICFSWLSQAQKIDNAYYEMRIYYCEAGKLPDLLTRFRNHTTKIFERHGMKNIGYWVPTQNDKNALYYILSFPSKEARDQSWKTFVADEEWKKVKEESEKNGKIINKIESIFMTLEDFSLKVKEIHSNNVFELRTYTCNPSKLETLETRFRNHTMKLFKKHGMKNIAYWKTIEKDGSQPKLIYILAHKSEAAAKASFGTFVNDPKWVKVRDKSEENGKIIEKIDSIFMTPTDFSPIK